jgi:16S rRNA (guanine527-N7)-methyltransferase
VDPRPIDPAEPLPQPDLTDAARAKLEPVIALLAADATAPSAVIEPERAWVVHVADSLSGLGFPELASARRIADVGAGAPGREAYDAVTARAVGRLSTLAELASPLLHTGGVLVGWKGRRNRDEELELEAGAPRLGVAPAAIRSADPYAGSRNRHLHLIRKTAPTPPDLPRRAGMAKKRPRGSDRGPVI